MNRQNKPPQNVAAAAAPRCLAGSAPSRSRPKTTPPRRGSPLQHENVSPRWATDSARAEARAGTPSQSMKHRARPLHVGNARGGQPHSRTTYLKRSVRRAPDLDNCPRSLAAPPHRYDSRGEHKTTHTPAHTPNSTRHAHSPPYPTATSSVRSSRITTRISSTTSPHTPPRSRGRRNGYQHTGVSRRSSEDVFAGSGEKTHEHEE
ncbi:Uncharacterised protein [Dermatophilus congolensis]|uniref:Uncharacterized protein n=1 Tax=Dermatophilus congolensis TaxID=1863 RepID=A0A239VL13_9MICO|nr:Uncharacterised protein [Dermatophilus congolensis]